LNWFKMFILICITEVLSIPMLNEHSPSFKQQINNRAL
jgi:hypothetical protein